MNKTWAWSIHILREWNTKSYIILRNSWLPREFMALTTFLKCEVYWFSRVNLFTPVTYCCSQRSKSIIIVPLKKMDVIAMLGPLGRMLLSQLSTNKQKGKCPMGKFSGRANNAFFLVLYHQGKKYELSRPRRIIQ